MSRWRRQLTKRHRRARKIAHLRRGFYDGLLGFVDDDSLDGAVPIPTFEDICQQNEKHHAFMAVINNVGKK